MKVVRRVDLPAVGLETTLLLHGIPRDKSLAFSKELCEIISSEGAHPALVGVFEGSPVVGLRAEELEGLLAADEVPKVNTSNLGLAIARGSHGATTVSTTMELLAAAELPILATGGIGGVHQGYGAQWDISADLSALARFPVAVVASGVKSVLDVIATREALETLGVPVIGFGTDVFPAFYLTDGEVGVDARFDDVESLADFLSFEMARTGRGVLVAHPIPPEAAIAVDQWRTWLDLARERVGDSVAMGRDKTPEILAALHTLSDGQTLTANLELVRSNTRLAARLAVSF